MVPSPSVSGIDESQYPFNSRYFDSETTNGSRIQDLINQTPFSSFSLVSLIEVTDGKAYLYENLALGNPEVAEFAYDTDRSPDIKIFFAAEDISHRKPVTLTRAAYLELLEKNGVSPGFIEVFANNNGACIGSPTYSNGEDYPELYVKFPRAPFINASIYFRCDVRTGRIVCLVFGSHIQSIQSRLQQLFIPTVADSSSQHRDPFLVLSAIAAEYVSVMENHRLRLDVMACEQESQTGMTALYYDESLLVRPSALPSRIKGLHVCDAYLMFFNVAARFQESWVAFLQQQHRIVNNLRRRVVQPNPTRASRAEMISSLKVQGSLDLSASLLQNMVLQVDTLGRRMQIQISVVQNLIAQTDSRTTISIADDSKRIALEAKKDSVAMKTIAGVTMVFLPGTFTATVFSMVFFKVGEASQPEFSVDSHWWLYIAVTIPLTGLVLVAWAAWLRWRMKGYVRTDPELPI